MNITKALADYQTRYPEEAETVQAFQKFLASHDDPLNRHVTDGHVTACVWIRSFDQQKVLLVDHKKLGKWVQLGGHVDPGETPLEAAMREAQEESGLTSLHLVSGEIYDLAIHDFPAVGDFPAHMHYDIRFLFEADGEEVPINSPESHAVHWVKRSQIEEYSQEPSVLRLSRKG